MVSLPIWIQIEIIIATEDTFTASKNTEKEVELRSFLTNGFNKATNTKEGKKIAKVEIIAPEIPLI
ncbi:hypothetical protein D3C85_1806200 [compost metagenome]